MDFSVPAADTPSANCTVANFARLPSAAPRADALLIERRESRIDVALTLDAEPRLFQTDRVTGV
jgi:hypothetical protein